MAEHEMEMAEKYVKMLHEFETADELAEYFEKQGIEATKQNSESCAISEYVKSNVRVH